MYLAQQEINLEQRFIRMVAEQKPQRSVELLKESIKKQLSSETLAMLKKLWEKEPAAANELANGVVDRLISASFTGTNNQVNHELFQVSNAILAEFIRERPPEEKGYRLR
jgi:flagellar biosynthesis/type III secretory pathway protein FliH